MATLKTRGISNNHTIEVREDRYNPDKYVTLEIGDKLVSVNRAEVLDAIGAVEPTPTPATPTPTVTRQDADTVLADGEVYVARSDRDIERYEGDIDYYEHKLAENRAVAKFLRAEQAEAQAPVNAEIVALEFAYMAAFPNAFRNVSPEVIRKLHAAGFRILP